MHRDAALFQVVQTLDAYGLFPGSGQGRQQQRSQNGNDRDYNQQFRSK